MSFKSILMLCTENGDIFSWGQNSHGQCGVDAKQFSIVRLPTVWSPLSRTLEPVSRVECGMRHVALLTTEGRVFTFGEGRHGQLGLGGTKSSHIPTRVSFPGEAKIASVSLGARHSLFLSESGDVFVTGCNRYGQCGTSQQSTPSSLVPFLVQSGTKKVSFICAGWNFSLMFHADSNTMLSCGRNQYCQLGIGRTSEFEDVPFVSNTDYFAEAGGVTDVKSGSEHTLVLTGSEQPPPAHVASS